MAAAVRTTLRGLLAHPELGLRLAVEMVQPWMLERTVRWVHSSDLADPTPFLAEDLVLLTTGTQFSPDDDAAAFEDYVRRLRARGVCALGFGTEVVTAGIPPLLVDACRGQGMPLFEVPYRTPFLAIARAHAEAVAAEAFARRSWALAAQRAIALAALRPDGLSATLAELARQLGAWVGLFDATGALTREHPTGSLASDEMSAVRAEVAAVLRRRTRAASSLRVGERAFTLQTLGRGEHLRGVIAIAAGELDPEGRSVVTSVIAMAGLALEQNEGLEQARRLLRAGLVQSLRPGDPSLARSIARQMWGGLPEAPIAVAAADAASDAVLEWLELRAHEHGDELFFGTDQERLLIVVPAGELAEATASPLLAELSAGFGLALGVSEPVAYAQFGTAVDQAVTALRRGSGGICGFAQVAASSVLSALDTAAARALAAAALAPLRAHDEAEGTALAATVRAWLEHDARFDETAAALGLHRHTVRARIALAQDLLGVDLGSFPARAELWAALQAGSR